MKTTNILKTGSAARWSAGFVLALSLMSLATLQAQEKIKALIVDGQNNHAVWPKSTIMMREYLEGSGLFEVDIARTEHLWQWEREKDYLPLAGVGERQGMKTPQPDPEFGPHFDRYDVVVSNFGWRAADWPEETRRAFEEYMAGGGGLVVVHAADNSWPAWEEFNKMIGLGGWGGRNEKDGPYVYCNDEGKIVRDASPGGAGRHGPQNEFLVTVRNHEHPITRGMPDFWMHSKDECYSRLRGPAENLTILATASDTPELKEAGRHEPMLMTIDYHDGRVFHTTLGHDDYSLEGVGFIVSFLRGAEWAATGKVTQEIPADFPGAAEPSSREFQLNPYQWVNLFNGEDLDGWSTKGGQAKYAVEEGAIVGTSQPNTPNTFLCPNRKFDDFELLFEVKCDPELNSGVQIRSIDDAEDIPADLPEAARARALRRVEQGSLCGPQVEIAAGGGAGGVYFEGVGGWVIQPNRELARSIYQRDDWNAYRVRVRGERIEVWINGVKISDAEDKQTHMGNGWLGFQVHGVGQRTEPLQVRWRHILVREL